MTTTLIEPPVVANLTEEIKPEPKPKAMIIDDAFDKEVYVEVEKYIDFYQFLEEDSKISWLTEITQLAPPDPEDAKNNPAEYKTFLNALFAARVKDEELLNLTNQRLFDEILSRQSDLDEICKNIESQEFEIQRLDSQSDGIEFIKEGNFKIIFLDYYLGQNPDATAVKNARDKAKALYEQCPEDSKPIIILMSSHEDVEDRLEQFKKDLGIGTIVFRATPKTRLINDGTASLLIQAYKNESAHIHKLQNYITSLKKAAESAFKEFNLGIDKFTIDDYAFIHNTTVMDQAHPLGDYLGWLYGAHWTNLLLKDPQLKIDKDTLDHLLQDKPALHYAPPSSHILEIYMSALFEVASEDIALHPMAGSPLQEGKKTSNEKPAKTVAGLPHLHLGDIFLNEDEKKLVWMVLNPQCDLERLTDEMAFNTILLVPGELSLLDFSEVGGQKTELVIIAGKEYRIVWKLKKVISVPVSEFIEWKDKLKLSRKFTLRLPYALEVQQAFTSLVSRVGLPVSPPIGYPVHIQVWIKRGDSFSILIEDKEKYGFRAITRKPTKIVRLTLAFALDLKAKLLEELKGTDEQANLGETAGNKTGVNKKALQELVDKFNEWHIGTRQIELPGKQKPVIDNMQHMHATENLEKVDKKKFPLILINFVTNEEAMQIALSGLEEEEQVLVAAVSTTEVIGSLESITVLEEDLKPEDAVEKKEVISSDEKRVDTNIEDKSDAELKTEDGSTQ